MERRLRVGLVWRTLAVAVAITSLAMATATFLFHRGHDTIFGLRRMLDPEHEASVHAWLGSSLLLSAGTAVFLVLRERPEMGRWRQQLAVLGAGLIFMSLDEIVQLHEKLVPVSRAVFGPDSPPQLWTLLALPVCLAIGVYFLPFLRSLPGAMRRNCLIAGGVYLFGALGFELIMAGHQSLFGRDEVLERWMAVLEETTELAGIAYFVGCLVEYLASNPPMEADA